jgi:uncharacterized protein (DUF4415 family)
VQIKERGHAIPRKPDPEFLDKDAPEATDAWFANALPAAKMRGDLLGQNTAQVMLKPKRGRPALAQPKAHVNIRLDADVLEAFKETGAGWQTRLNSALRDWLKTHPKATDV